MPPVRCLQRQQEHRVVPYEGILVAQRDLTLAISTGYLLYLPGKARQQRLNQVKKQFLKRIGDGSVALTTKTRSTIVYKPRDHC